MVVLRRAYEKARVPTRTVRRGRVEGVPAEVYAELDEIVRRLDGLMILQGANNAAIAAAVGTAPPVTGATPTPGQQNPEATKEIDFTAILDYSGSAGASNSGQLSQIAFPFRIVSLTISVESSTGSGTISAKPFLYVAGKEKLTAASNAATVFAHDVAKSYPGQVVEGQEKGGIVQFSPGTVQFKITNASPTARVKGTLALKLKVPVSFSL